MTAPTVTNHAPAFGWWWKDLLAGVIPFPVPDSIAGNLILDAQEIQMP
jgi:hypothetical protein